MDIRHAQQILASDPAAVDPSPRAALPGAAMPTFAQCRHDSALVRAWLELEATGSLPTQSFAFAAALDDTLLAETEIAIAAASGPGGVAALLPLCRGPGWLDRWRLAGADEVFEPGDALFRDQAAVTALAETLARLSRPLDLDRIPAASPLIPALRAAMKGRGMVAVRPARASPTIALDEGWKMPESQFNSGRRSDFRRAARRAAEEGALGFEMLSPGPEEFDALFDEAIAVELRSWKREAGTAILSDPAKERFFRAWFRAASAAGALRIAFLRIGGKVVAMQLALETLGRYWLFKIGFDEGHARCSPGNLLMLETIGWAARRGLASFELLGDVEPWIATFWTRAEHDCVRVRTYPFGPRGAAALVGDTSIWLRRRLGRTKS